MPPRRRRRTTNNDELDAIVGATEAMTRSFLDRYAETVRENETQEANIRINPANYGDSNFICDIQGEVESPSRTRRSQFLQDLRRHARECDDYEGFVMSPYTNGWTFTCSTCGFHNNLTFATMESEGITHRIFHRFFRDYCCPSQGEAQPFGLGELVESEPATEENNRRNRRGRKRSRPTPDNAETHNHPFDGLEV